MGNVNREYKDRLFNFLFGAEENKAWTLSLYNAVSGSSYTDPDMIQITTIREVMYLSMHNDTAFLIAEMLNLYEQQSTRNPNMPLRMLQYAGNLYEKYLVAHKMNKYSTKLLKLPVPKLVVFYNGTQDVEDETTLRLSDSFPPGADADIEARVRMININYGRSKHILDACRPLREYAWLVEEIRVNRQLAEIDEAVDKAITDMPKDFIIRPYLEEHRSEVKGMLLTEYNEVETMELFREEGREEGRAEGREEGRAEGRSEGFIEAVITFAKEGVISISDGALRTGMSEEEFRKQVAS